MSNPDQGRFRHALQRLIMVGSLQSAYPGDQEDYEVVSQMRNLVEEWLFMADMRLFIDDEYGFIRLEEIGIEDNSSQANDQVQIATRDELAILLILRSALEEERAHSGAAFYRLTIGDLRSLYESKMNRMRLSAAKIKRVLIKFRKLHLIHYRGSLDESDTSILILPLMFMLTPERIQAIQRALVSQKASLPEEDEGRE
ncbi:MAG: DUF4194 domain-containing protein [Bacteroidales bacterium]